ncbi:MAG: flavodoxin family protein [Deltaproteobacteria bacterium]|nr:flavodoxin family protein [Deltaproteobacteria bacterium]
MKILNVYGSFINGSSATIANHFLEKAGQLGAEIQSFNFIGKTINSCKKCMSCKTTTDKCVIQDDMMAVFDALVKCDVLVLSTGVYVSDVAVNMSIIESRLFSLLKPDYETHPHPSRLPPGKKLVFIQTQEYPKDWHTDIYERFKVLFRKLEFSDVFVIHADYISTPSDLQESDDIMKQVDELAVKINRGGS